MFRYQVEIQMIYFVSQVKESLTQTNHLQKLVNLNLNYKKINKKKSLIINFQILYLNYKFIYKLNRNNMAIKTKKLKKKQ